MQKFLKSKKCKGRKVSKQATVIHLVYSVSVHMGLHSYKESFKYLEKFWSYRAYTKNCEKMQREITRKVSKLELCHLFAACLIIWIYIPIKVHPNTLNNFDVMEYTQKFVRKNIKKYLSPKIVFFTKKFETN